MFAKKAAEAMLKVTHYFPHKMMHYRFGLATLFLLMLSQALAVTPREPIWNEETTGKVRIHLGIYPASELDHPPALVDPGRSLHGSPDSAPGIEHLVVALFDAKSGERITNATVIATIRYVRGHRTSAINKTVERALERIVTEKQISYGNFFPMENAGDYTIDVKIYGPDWDGAQMGRFSFTKVE